MRRSLEEELALANVALDHIGQARMLYGLRGDEARRPTAATRTDSRSGATRATTAIC